jgi:hypothetical protein
LYLFTYRIILQPPAIRVFLLGSRGSGKSLYGRELAEKLGLFHIQFREYLQELVLCKTKKRVRPEREEEQELEEQDLPPDDEFVASSENCCIKLSIHYCVKIYPRVLCIVFFLFHACYSLYKFSHSFYAITNKNKRKPLSEYQHYCLQNTILFAN